MERPILVNIFVAVITAIAVAPAAYYVNDFLARDRVSIATIDFQPELTPYRLNLADFYKAEDGSGIYRSDFDTWLNQRSLAFSVKDLFARRDGRSLNRSERAELASAMTSYVAYLNRKRDRVVEFKSKLETEATEEELNELSAEAFNSGIYFNQTGKAPSRSLLIKAIENRSKEISDNIKVVETIALNASSFTPVRTGNLAVHVTFLNVGNNDGLIKPDAFLRIKDQSESWAIREWDGNAVKVDKRSLREAWFWIDETKLDEGEKREIRAIIQKAARVPVSIEFRDFRGNAVVSPSSALPASDADRD